MHANMAILQALIPLSVISNVEDIAGFLGLKVLKSNNSNKCFSAVEMFKIS